MMAIDQMAQRSMGRMFGDVPGGDVVGGMILKKVRKELGKLDEETLGQYLWMLSQLATSIRTGENFGEIMEAGTEE